MRHQFSEVPVDALFSLNGNLWQKHSTRTAQLILPLRFYGSIFYFRQQQQITTLVIEE